MTFKFQTTSLQSVPNICWVLTLKVLHLDTLGLSYKVCVGAFIRFLLEQEAGAENH